MTKDDALKLALEALEASAPWVELTNEAITNDKAIADIKEALAHPAQEPVAWMYPDALCDRNCLYVCTKAFTQFPECATTPPQRPWVGLTDKDKTEILNTTERDERGFVMELVEAKLKDKNNAA